MSCTADLKLSLPDMMASVGTEPLCFAFVLPCLPSANWANQGFGAAAHPSCSGSSAAGWELWSGDLTDNNWSREIRVKEDKGGVQYKRREKRGIGLYYKQESIQIVNNVYQRGAV